MATSPNDPLSGLPSAQRNAYVGLTNLLAQYGLESLASKLLGFVKQGYDGDSLNYLLSQTPEYKQRFAANDVRVKNGLAPLAPAEYLAAERSYRQVLQSSGLPRGFYDSPNDFTNLIAADISPNELQKRADYAFQFAQNVHPDSVAGQAISQLRDYYNVDQSHVAAFFLDPQQTTALLDRKARAAQIGGALAANGVNVDQGHAESYADSGISYAQAQQAAANAGLIRDDALNAAKRFQIDFTNTDLADATVGGLASAQRKLRTVSNSEAGLFAGDAGAIGALSANPGGAN